MRKLGSIIAQVFTYIFLMIDRLILVPFVFVSSYSAQELSKKADRFAMYAIIRVAITVVCVLVYLLLKWIF